MRRLDHRSVLIELSGAIQGEVLDTLRELLVSALMRYRSPRIVVDLQAITSIDSAAIGCLVAASDAATDLGLGLAVRNSPQATILA